MKLIDASPNRSSSLGHGGHPSGAHAVRRPRFAAMSLACVATLALLSAGCQTTARSTRPTSSDDVDRSVTLPRTLANVWYRADIQPDNHIPFSAMGTLLVGSDAIVYSSESESLTIPTRAIRSVVWRQMNGDLQNEWAVIIWLEGGAERMVGFTAADGYRFDTSNRELYSAISVSATAQSGL